MRRPLQTAIHRYIDCYNSSVNSATGVCTGKTGCDGCGIAATVTNFLRLTSTQLATTKKPAAARKTSGGSVGVAKKTSASAKRNDPGAIVRDVVSRSVSAPVNLVMLTADRVQEVLMDAAKRGRLTTDDAQDLAQTLLRKSREQKQEVLREINDLIDSATAKTKSHAKRKTTKSK